MTDNRAGRLARIPQAAARRLMITCDGTGYHLNLLQTGKNVRTMKFKDCSFLLFT